MRLLQGIRLGAFFSGVASFRSSMQETATRSTYSHPPLIGTLGQFAVWLSLLTALSCCQVDGFAGRGV